MCRWQDFQNPPQMYKSFVIACLILIYFSDVLLLIRQTARFLFARQPFAFLSHSLTQFFSLSPNFLLSLRLTNEAGDCTALRARSQEKTSAPRAHATDAEQGCYFLFCFVFSFLSHIAFFFSYMVRVGQRHFYPAFSSKYYFLPNCTKSNYCVEAVLFFFLGISPL